MEELLNVSPIDGRYRNMTEEVREYFSEYHLIKNRVLVEIRWLEKLFSLKELGLELSKDEVGILDKIEKEFDENRSQKSKRNRTSNKT